MTGASSAKRSLGEVPPISHQRHPAEGVDEEGGEVVRDGQRGTVGLAAEGQRAQGDVD